MARHRRTLHWGLLATVWCSVAASVVPYWSGRAVNALEHQDWHGSRVYLAWMLAFTAIAGIGRYLMRNTLIGLSREVEREQRESLYGFLLALAWPVMSLGWSANLFQRARAGQERLDYLLHSPERPLPPAEPITLPETPASLALEGVTHRFETGRGLGPLDLSLAPGDSLAVVGGIGSGKTLLLQVLAGLREPQSGRMRVDGEPLTDANLRRHWAGLGWVPQDAFLFSDTLRVNLAMGRPEATEDELWEIARVVAMDDLIRRLPDGLDTVVGERGVVLSGGERQRTALARALLRRPRLLLLDDALSAVDAETESRILENLRGFLGKSTLLVATHRVFVAETCARVLVLEEGRTVQLGTPEALAAQPGLFARLRKLQSLERELVRGV